MPYGHKLLIFQFPSSDLNSYRCMILNVSLHLYFTEATSPKLNPDGPVV